MEIIRSEPAVDPTNVDWRQECRKKSIAEVLQSEDAVLINDSDDKIADDVTKVTASEVLDSLDAVKCFTEIHRDKQMSVMLNELIGEEETLKLPKR